MFLFFGQTLSRVVIVATRNNNCVPRYVVGIAAFKYSKTNLRKSFLMSEQIFFLKHDTLVILILNCLHF